MSVNRLIAQRLIAPSSTRQFGYYPRRYSACFSMLPVSSSLCRILNEVGRSVNNANVVHSHQRQNDATVKSMSTQHQNHQSDTLKHHQQQQQQQQQQQHTTEDNHQQQSSKQLQNSSSGKRERSIRQGFDHDPFNVFNNMLASPFEIMNQMMKPNWPFTHQNSLFSWPTDMHQNNRWMNHHNSNMLGAFKVEENDQAFLVSVDLPGVKKDAIKIRVTGEEHNRMLHISGERSEEFDFDPDQKQQVEVKNNDSTQQQQQQQQQQHVQPNEQPQQSNVQQHRSNRGHMKSYGQFSRSVSVPENVEIEKISAKSSDGVLRIMLPKRSGQKQTEPEHTIRVD